MLHPIRKVSHLLEEREKAGIDRAGWSSDASVTGQVGPGAGCGDAVGRWLALPINLAVLFAGSGVDPTAARRRRHRGPMR